MTGSRITAGLMLGLSTVSVLGVFGSAAAQEVPHFLTTRQSAYSFDDTLDRLRGAIADANLMLIHEVNPQQMLRMVGVRTGGMRQLFFFHPRYMQALLERDRNAGIVPPLKVLVMEAPNGRVMVRYHEPLDLFAAYVGVDEVATELSNLLQRMISVVE